MKGKIVALLAWGLLGVALLAGIFPKFIPPESELLRAAEVSNRPTEQATTERQVSFDLSGDESYVVLNTRLHSRNIDPEASLLLTLQGPEGTVVHAWEVELGECHLTNQDQARDSCDSHDGQEHVVLNEPNPGRYTVVVRPGQKLSHLPNSGDDAIIVNAIAFSSSPARDNMYLAGTDYWQIQHDGSKEKVEGGAIPLWMLYGVVPAIVLGSFLSLVWAIRLLRRLPAKSGRQ